MNELFLKLNWTWDAIVLMLLGAFIVEGFRILGRQSAPNVARTKFSFKAWRLQFSNWFSIILSIACSFTLVAVRGGVVGSVGLAVEDPDTFYPLYSLGVGAFGQSIMKIVLKGFMGLFGAYGNRPPKPEPEPDEVP